MNDKLKICKTTKNKKMIIYDNHSYHYNAKIKNKISWRCTKRSCTGYIHTNNDITEIIKLVEHNHEESDNLIKKYVFFDNFKEECFNGKTTFHDVFSNLIETSGDSIFSKLPKYTSLRDYFSRKRRFFDNNQIKDTISDIPNCLKLTLSNKKFLFVDSGFENSNRYIIFTTEEFLKRLSLSNVWLGDATFKIVPCGFTQLFVIHGKCFNEIIPLVFVLMAKKNEESYKAVFNDVKNLVEKEPEYYISDFENAQINAFKLINKNAKQSGCYFHFSQILWRWIQNDGMIKKYKSDVMLRSCFKNVLSLCFVRNETINEFFNLIKKRYLPFGECFNLFLGKFERLYIDNESSINRSFVFWNCHNSIINNIPITTNSLEAWHSSLNSMIKKAHPNIAKLINILQREEQRILLKIETLRKGKATVKYKKYVELLNILQNEESYSFEEFLDNISDNIGIKRFFSYFF